MADGAPRILVLDEAAPTLGSMLAARGVSAVTATTPDEVSVPADEVEVLLASPALAAVVVGDLPGLGWVQSTWAGVERLLAVGLPDGVVLTRLEGVFGPQMREFVLGYLLGHTQRVTERIVATAWDDSWSPSMLSGGRMGVLGTGSIGRAVADAAVCFGLEVIGCSRSGASASPFSRVEPVDRVLDFASGLDHLVVVLPHTSETIGIVDASVIEVLNMGATLVNVGRGSTVHSAAVVDALASGRLGLAVLDVVEGEPLAADDPLWDVDGLVITSHTAAWSRPSDVIEVFADNLDAWISGRPLRGVVDPARGY